VTNDVTD
jgi:transposase